MHSLRRNKGRRREWREGGGEDRARGWLSSSKEERTKSRQRSEGRQRGAFQQSWGWKFLKSVNAERAIPFLRAFSPLFLSLRLTSMSRSTKRKDTSYKSPRTWHFVFRKVIPAKIAGSFLKAEKKRICARSSRFIDPYLIFIYI